MSDELVSCEICGTHNYKPFLSTSGYDTPYELVKCQTCGLVFMNPRPHSQLIREYYQEKYFEQQLGSKEPPKSYLSNNLRLDKKRLKFVETYIGEIDTKSLLDVGCGCGTFLKLIKDAYPALQYNGVEPNTYFSDYARKHNNIEIQTNNLENFNTEEKFDIICFWQVLNMVPNPLYLLDYMKTFLQDNGTLFIEVPNYLQSPKIPWKKRVYPKDPGQFFYFDKNTMSLLLNKAGFVVTNFAYTEKMSWMILSAKHGKPSNN